MALFIRKLLLLFLFNILNFLYECPGVESAANFKLVCYYTNWAIYRPSLAKFTPQNINPYMCTHLIYAFAGLTRRFEVKPFDAYNDIQQGNFNKFIDLKKYNKDLKTMIAIGGWNEGSKKFSEMVSEDKNRKKFIKSVLKFLREHRFDGLDLDWEYPTFRDGSRPEDREGYASLVEELRETFDNEQLSSGKKRLLLTMAVPAGKQYIDQGYDIPTLAKNLDFFNLLTYDFYTTSEGLANHHSALYGVKEYEDWDVHGQLNVDFTVNHYLDLGVPSSKIVVGVPTYGRAFTLEDSEEYELGSPIKGAAEAGPATREAGYLAYFEICQNIKDKDWEVHQPHPDAMGPYAVKDDQWVGYDDEDMVIRKAKYVIENKLGGLMFWSLDTDDFRGNCGFGNSPLINAARKTLFSKQSKHKPKSSDDVNEYEEEEQEEETPPKPKSKSRVTTSRPKRTTTTTEATTPIEEPIEEEVIEDEIVEENEEVKVTARPNARADSSSFGSRSSRSSRKRGRKQEEEEEEEEFTTPEPPTTPDPGPAFECKDEGFFRNPSDCRKYFWCLDSGPADLGIIPNHFTCPSGLFFNTNSDSCDYKDNVNCKLNPALATTTTLRPPRTTTRKPKRTTTTTEAEPEEEVIEEEATTKSGDNVAELLHLIKKLGGVEQVQKHLGLGSQGDAPEAPKSRVPSTRAKARPAAEEEETLPVASIAEETPTQKTRARTTRRRIVTTTTAEPEVTTRARRPTTLRSLRRTTSAAVEEAEEETETRAPRRRVNANRGVRRTTTSEPEEDVQVDNSRQSTTVQKFQNVDKAPILTARRPKIIVTTTEDSPPTQHSGGHADEDLEGHTFRQTRIPQLFRYVNVNRSISNDETTEEAIEEDATVKKSTEARQLKSILDALDEPTTDGMTADQSTLVTSRNARQSSDTEFEDTAAKESTNVHVASPDQPQVEHLPFENIGVHLEERAGEPAIVQAHSENVDVTETAHLETTVKPVHQGTTAEPVHQGTTTEPFDEYYYVDEEVTEEPQITPPTTTEAETQPSTTTRRFLRPLTTRPTTTTKAPLPPRILRTTTTTARPPVLRKKTVDVAAGVEAEFEGLSIDEDGQLECFEQGVYPHPTDCDKYVSCVHQQSTFTPYIYTCSVGQLYDEFTGRCLNEDAVDCTA